jgi:hypothetical protein
MQPNNLYSSVVSINGVLYASQAMPMAPGMYSSTSSQAGVRCPALPPDAPADATAASRRPPASAILMWHLQVFQGRSVRGSSQNKLAEGEGTVWPAAISRFFYPHGVLNP